MSPTARPMTDLHWLSAGDPPDSFPDPKSALSEPDGLLAVGGDLSPERLLAAYRHGIFPWFNADQPILWWSPDPRAVLLPNELHVSRSLRRRLRRDDYRVSADQCFGRVIDACAQRRRDEGTWITPEMRLAYCKLHELGFAHSIESWREDELVGGLYGVNIGRVFFGESMFSRRTDASKVALVALVGLGKPMGLELIDCQLASSHLASLGSRLVPRERFLELLERYCAFPSPSGWQQGQMETSALA